MIEKVLCACGCGKLRDKYDNQGRIRGCIWGHLGGRGFQKEKRPDIHCSYCGKFLTKLAHYEHNFCNDKCRGLWARENLRGKSSPNWKGGKKYMNGGGYILIYKPNHPFCDRNGRIFEHRLIMEKYLGRYLKPKEIIHHRNGIKDDNKIENLELFKNNGEHSKMHLSGRNSPKWRGGISRDSYPVKFQKLREIIRKRDNYICQLCSIKQNGRAHCVHHIDYDKENLDFKNLVTLCRNCNVKANTNREYWTKYFQNKLRERGILQ